MASSRCYVGNIPWTATETELTALFAPARVVDVKIVTDRETQRPRGFAFVTLENETIAEEAIARLDATSMGGRTLTVSYAKEREQGGGGRGGDRKPTHDRGQRRTGREGNWRPDYER